MLQISSTWNCGREMISQSDASDEMTKVSQSYSDEMDKVFQNYADDMYDKGVTGSDMVTQL